MNYRELWLEIMNYGDFDRPCNIHWKGWPETYPRWHDEGMPEDVDEHEFFQANPLFSRVGVNVSLYPGFERETLEETDEYRIFRDVDGVIQKQLNKASSVPHFIDFTLQTADDWPEYKKRLQPDQGRIGDDLDEKLREAENSGNPVQIWLPSMMGWIRNWMGVENMCYLMFDDPDCFGDMVATLSDLGCWAIDQVVPRMNRPPDLGWSWEDICGRSGPFVSPDIFDKYVAPGYTKLRNKLEAHGVKFYGIDSDGRVEPLVRHWLDAGVNIQFPVEPGTWGATPEDFRAKFGKELRIQGGFDKLVLETTPAAIDAEIDKHIPLMKQGGFVMMPDHLITPDTPLANYRYYLKRIREMRF
jgi:uroporphyrinogen decarboxylase